jgi:putative NADH-flavin reductase
MKTIALFGATGQSGQAFLKAALEKGYNVRAQARTPEKIGLQHENLTVLKGDVLDEAAVESVVHNSDVVVSLFGHVKNSPANLQTQGTKNIVAAMKKYTVQRIISLSGGGLPFPEKDQPKFADKAIRTIMKLFFSKMLNDAIAHYEYLQHSGVQWTIVRAPRLTNDPKTNQYRVGWVGVNASTQISRGDLADFVVTLVEDEQYDGQLPFVSA